jgi:hypothetical protein
MRAFWCKAGAEPPAGRASGSGAGTGADDWLSLRARLSSLDSDSDLVAFESQHRDPDT